MQASMHRRSLQFYQAILLLFIISLSLSLLYFWKNGYLDGTKNRKLTDTTYKLKKIEKKNELKEVKTLFFKNDLKRSLSTLGSFKNQIGEINRIINVDQVKNLDKSILTLERSVKGIAQYPKVKEILKVYNEKMGNFENFVYFNNWKTLSRLSKRVFARMNALHFSDSTFYSAISENEKDIKKMKKVTKSSILVKTLKTKIQRRLDSLLVELSMLKEYLKLRKKSSVIHSKLNANFNKWLDAVVPELAVQKLKTEQVGRMYFTAFSVLTAIFFGIFLIGFPLTTTLNLKGKDDQELEVLGIIEKSFIEDNVDKLPGMSSHFKNKISQFSKHLKKRMSFGSIFQESLPFDSILIDENFKVVWGNDPFFKKWGIDKESMIKETISWDYIAKLIEFGESDPVIDALRNNLGGIFEVKIKLPNRTEKISYEIYVSPVENNGKKHAMIFFYCLETLQSAIADYQDSMMTPVEKMMKVFNIQMNKEDLTGLKFNFDEKELTHLYKKFETLYDSITISRDSFMKQVDQLETENNELTERLAVDTKVLRSKLESETTILSGKLQNETAILTTKIEDQVEDYESRLKIQEEKYESLIKSQNQGYEETLNSQVTKYEDLIKTQNESFEERFTEETQSYESQIQKTQNTYQTYSKESNSSFESALTNQKNKYENQINLLTSTFEKRFKEKITKNDENFKNEVSSYENEISDQTEIYNSKLKSQNNFFDNKFQNIAKENAALISNNQILKRELSTIKNEIINLSANNSELVKNSKRTVELFGKSLSNYKEIVGRNEQLFINLRDGMVSTVDVDEVRADFKELRSELIESKNKVFQNFQELVNFKKYVTDFEGKKKLHEIVTGAKANVKNLDEKTNILDRKFQMIEKQISATTSLLKSNSDKQFEKRLHTDAKIIAVMENGKSILDKNIQSLGADAEKVETNVITSIKVVYDTYKQSNAASHIISAEIESAQKEKASYFETSNTLSIS